MKTTDFTTAELTEYIANDQIMFFTRWSLSQLYYSQASQQFYFIKLRKFAEPYCKARTFFAMTTANACHYESMAN